MSQVDAPWHHWRMFGLRWDYECRYPKGLRWGVSDGCRGVDMAPNPLVAYLRLRAWRKDTPLGRRP